MFGAKWKVQAPVLVLSSCDQIPRLVAAHTRPPPKRIRPIVVDSSSLPPTRSAMVKLPVRGLARRNTPAPEYAVPPVLASPSAYHSEPSSSAAIPVMRPDTKPRPPLELE